MNFGDVAVEAVKLINNGLFDNPRQAWTNAAKKCFPNSPSMQAKPCPRCTFLGLCEEGLVKGINKGSYTTSVLEKGYAVNAVNTLRRKPKMVNKNMQLWSMVAGNKTYNKQMDVVIALWNEGLIL